MNFVFNPIITREWRTRPRNGASWLLFVALVLWTACVLWRVATSPSANAGHNAFQTLVLAQMLFWLVTLPTQTATSIAGERERGLLEALQLSTLKPHQIIFGRLGATLLFALQGFVAAWPLWCVCIWLGGVSSGDVWLALALQIAVVLASCAVGLCASAWSLRAATALRITVVSLVLWLLGSTIAWEIAIIGTALRTAGLPFKGGWALALWGHTNPFLTWQLRMQPDVALLWNAPLARAVSPFDFAPWWVSLVFLLASTPILLALAVWAMRRPLIEPDWTQSRAEAKIAAKTANLSRNADAKYSTKTGQAPETAKNAAIKEIAWWEFPVASRLHFRNAVLQREARGKFRVRQIPRAAMIGQGILALIVAGFYVLAIYLALTNASSRPVIWWVLCFVATSLLVVAAPALGAVAWTRERESGTFEGLQLSLLQPREILSGKMGASVLACLAFPSPIYPLLLLCVRFSSRDGITPFQAIATLTSVVCCVFCFISVGTFISWHCRRSAVSLAYTAAFLLLACNIPLHSGEINTHWMPSPFGVLQQIIAVQSNVVGISTSIIQWIFWGTLAWFGTERQMSRRLQ